jgi:hypothetical protein
MSFPKKQTHIIIMKTRSGLDHFDRIFTRISGEWPTVEQARALSIKTSNMDEFCEHSRWVLNKGSNKTSSRLAVLAMAESIKQCPELHSGMPMFIMTIVEKLRDVDNKPEFLVAYIRSFSKYL